MAKLADACDKQGDAYFFWCEGCSMMHMVPTRYNPEFADYKGKPKPTWRFNGSFEKPTFIPAIVVQWVGADPPQRCHCIVRDGEIIYLTDSTHKLSGSRVKMKHLEDA